MYYYLVRDKDTRFYDPMFIIRSEREISQELDDIICEVWQIEDYNSEMVALKLHDYAKEQGFEIDIIWTFTQLGF